MAEGRGRTNSEYEIFMRGVNRYKRYLASTGKAGEARQVDRDLRGMMKSQRSADLASRRPDKIGKGRPNPKKVRDSIKKSRTASSSRYSTWNPLSK